MKTCLLKSAKLTCKILLICLGTIILSSNKIEGLNSLPSGVVMCGAEFGQSNMPGVINKDYVYPTLQQFKYYQKKGIKQIALPIRWERIQQKLFGPLDPLNTLKIKEVLEYAKATNIRIILDLHNYGRYRINNVDIPMGTNQVSIEAFANVWEKLASHFKQYSQIIGYQIMAEPHDLGKDVWFNAAQLAINKIRAENVFIPIIVDGDNWASAYKWQTSSDNLKLLLDERNNIVYSSHCYFDEDGSGKYNDGYKNNYNENIGVEKVTPFITWLKNNNKRGFIGEYGVPNNDTRWLKVMDNFLLHLTKYNVGCNYWAAGSWWHNYPLSIEPIAGKEKPQMQILVQHVSRN